MNQIRLQRQLPMKRYSQDYASPEITELQNTGAISACGPRALTSSTRVFSAPQCDNSRAVKAQW